MNNKTSFTIDNARITLTASGYTVELYYKENKKVAAKETDYSELEDGDIVTWYDCKGNKEIAIILRGKYSHYCETSCRLTSKGKLVLHSDDFTATKYTKSSKEEVLEIWNRLMDRNLSWDDKQYALGVMEASIKPFYLSAANYANELNKNKWNHLDTLPPKYKLVNVMLEGGVYTNSYINGDGEWVFNLKPIKWKPIDKNV